MHNFCCDRLQELSNEYEGKTSKSTELDILPEYMCKCDVMYFDTYNLVWKKDIKYIYVHVVTNRSLTQIQLWGLGDCGHFVAFLYLQTMKRLKCTVYNYIWCRIRSIIEENGSDKFSEPN